MRTAVAAIALGAGAIALVQGVHAAPKKSAGVSIPAEQIVAARRAAMVMSAATSGSLKALANGDDLKRASFPARGLHDWAKAIPSMFPAGTDVAPSETLPAAWSDRAGFEAAARSFAEATDSLGKAAAANDKVAYAAALDQVNKGCSGCHDKYRKPQEKR